MTILAENLGKEVYIGGGDLDSYAPAPIFVEKTLLAFEKKVHLVPIHATEELKAIHGYLTAATSIPNSIPDNTEIFLILPNANLEHDNFIVEIPSLYLLKKVVETMVSLDKINEDDTEEVIDYVTNIEKQKIEEIFVVYGYSIEMTHHIQKKSCRALNFKSESESLKQVVESQV